MSSLALITKKNGIRTGGSDRTNSDTVEMLRKNGIEVFIGHSANNVKGYDAVVYTAAIPESNPELVYAKENGLATFYRGDYLGSIMLGYGNRIGVAGMHGKSTVTGMISHIYLELGLDPTVLNGANVRELGGAYRVGESENFIFEACEYKDTFLSFHPDTAVLLNLEMDHVDYFKSMEQIKESFLRYASIASKTVANGDDAELLDALKTYKGELYTFGKGEECDFRIVAPGHTEKGFARFSLEYKGGKLCDVTLSIPGDHNAYNAAAAVAASFINGVDAGSAAKAMETFRGVMRRIEYRGEMKGVDIYDDYAHHPSEIKASLGGLRKLTKGKLLCVYQPHTYSRTAGLFDEFAGAFKEADEVVFADIYAAREVNTFGVSSKQLAERIEGAKYFPSFGEIADYLKQTARPGDLIVVMGAGDIIELTDILLEK